MEFDAYFDDFVYEDIDLNFDLGTCEGCGAYGKVKTAHYRNVDGEMQECGEFV